MHQNVTDGRTDISRKPDPLTEPSCPPDVFITPFVKAQTIVHNMELLNVHDPSTFGFQTHLSQYLGTENTQIGPNEQTTHLAHLKCCTSNDTNPQMH